MMNVKKMFLGLYWLSISPLVWAQNLVLNPSFEQGSPCDGSTENIESAEHWTRLAGKPRFINLGGCPLSKDTKTYLQGIQLPPAAEGNGYAGLGIDTEGEYLQGELSKALEANKVYWVKLRLRMPTRFCNATIQELGIVFTDKKTEATEKYRQLDLPAAKLQNNDQTAFSASLAWKEVWVFYTAKGGETHFVLGNFKGQNAEIFVQRKKGDCTYLYIDAVSVEEYNRQELPIFEPNIAPLAQQRFLLEDIRFDGELLDKASYRALEPLITFLLKHPNATAEISGHTDNEQDEYTNKMLSQKRAEALIEYLSTKKIAKERLKAVGKGSSQNLVPNNTLANRLLNQRIEIQFVKL